MYTSAVAGDRFVGALCPASRWLSPEQRPTTSTFLTVAIRARAQIEGFLFWKNKLNKRSFKTLANIFTVNGIFQKGMKSNGFDFPSGSTLWPLVPWPHGWKTMTNIAGRLVARMPQSQK